ncbi:TPA: hypothetical protein ACH3X1_004798 [Trebouxia sp. C0004]
MKLSAKAGVCSSTQSIIGSLVAGSSIGLLPLAAAAAVGIDAVVNKVIVGIWLHQMLWEQSSAWQQDAALTASFPTCSAPICQSGLPEKFLVTLQELQAWICTSASETKIFSPEAKTKFDAEVKAIEHVLVGLLHTMRDPVQRWVDPYPDWLDRIAYVQTLSILNAAQPIQKTQTSKMDALQESLTSLQASEHWPQAVKRMGVKDKCNGEISLQAGSQQMFRSRFDKWDWSA